MAIVASLALITAPDTSASTVTPSLPTDIIKAAPQLHLLGQGVLRYLFWKIYDIASYVSGTTWRDDAPHALAVVYARAFTGAEIADEGVKQMRHLGYQDTRQLDRWRADMLMGFPVVHPGDQVTAVFFPPDETRFYINNLLTAEVHDVTFSQAFFGIWLSPQSSEPKLRRTLLGQDR
jgi:hypothetical protein